MRWGRLATFYGVALTGPALAALVIATLQPGSGLSTVVTALAMFAPLAGAVVCHRLDGRFALDGLARFKASRWLVMAALVPVLIALLTLGISTQLPGVAWDWELTALLERLAAHLPPEELDKVREELSALPIHPVWLSLPQAVVAGCTINALFAFGEEAGWRGWLEGELCSLGFWTRSLVVGTLWGFWHAPLILVGHNYPDHPVQGVFLFVLICIGLAPWHSHVRQAGGTVWAAAFFHGTFNAAAGVTALVVSGSDLVIGAPGLAGGLALLLANAGLALLRRQSKGLAL